MQKSTIQKIVDCIKRSEEEIKDKYITNCDIAKTMRVINVSENIKKLWDDFHKRIMEKKLYKNYKVQVCCFKAKEIIKDLFEAYSSEKSLIPRDFVKTCNRSYCFLKADDKLLMTVRNYISGMTDSFAIEQHKRLYMSSEKATIL